MESILFDLYCLMIVITFVIILISIVNSDKDRGCAKDITKSRDVKGILLLSIMLAIAWPLIIIGFAFRCIWGRGEE